ncbi:hypothetical protein BGZ83_010746 [Gryganskiella cystojenkinii]|nr:hypothetical protein BGZ83_010746 [Gryganskiella cystojenkinii]
MNGTVPQSRVGNLRASSKTPSDFDSEATESDTNSTIARAGTAAASESTTITTRAKPSKRKPQTSPSTTSSSSSAPSPPPRSPSPSHSNDDTVNDSTSRFKGISLGGSYFDDTGPNKKLKLKFDDAMLESNTTPAVTTPIPVVPVVPVDTSNFSGWGSDTLSSGPSDLDLDDDDDDDFVVFNFGKRKTDASTPTLASTLTSNTLSSGRVNGHDNSNSRSTRRQSIRSSNSTTLANPFGSKSDVRKNRTKAKVQTAMPNGLRKLPKGYVYDTEINQSALMEYSVNPSQTGDFMQHLKGVTEKENDFPDRRKEYDLDLTQEPSTFGFQQETGYTYPRLRGAGKGRLPKEHCEDGLVIADMMHNDTYLGRLFCVTDGHGGKACSMFVVATVPGAIQAILGRYSPSDYSKPEVQARVKKDLVEAILLIDYHYLEWKKSQYLLYKEKKTTTDPGSDGTTLIVNIFIDKWIICLNVGDSRSMVGSRDAEGRWEVEFYSEDHTPSLERLAQTIYANGGEFVTHDDKLIRFDANLKNDKKHRQALKEARIRVKDGATNSYGIPYRTKNGQCASVNLGACIGDVLYKLDPDNPILSAKPDVTFIDITTIHQGFLLMASDGLWDYVQRGGKAQEQNQAVCQYVGDKLDRDWSHQRIVCTLANREAVSGLYSDSIQEYDDFTAILVPFNQEQLKNQQRRRRELEEKLLAKEKEQVELKHRLAEERQQQELAKRKVLEELERQRLAKEAELALFHRQAELEELQKYQRLLIQKEEEELKLAQQQQEQQQQQKLQEQEWQLKEQALLRHRELYQQQRAQELSREQQQVRKQGLAKSVAKAAENAAAAIKEADDRKRQAEIEADTPEDGLKKAKKDRVDQADQGVLATASSRSKKVKEKETNVKERDTKAKEKFNEKTDPDQLTASLKVTRQRQPRSPKQKQKPKLQSQGQEQEPKLVERDSPLWSKSLSPPTSSSSSSLFSVPTAAVVTSVRSRLSASPEPEQDEIIVDIESESPPMSPHSSKYRAHQPQPHPHSNPRPNGSRAVSPAHSTDSEVLVVD